MPGPSLLIYMYKIRRLVFVATIKLGHRRRRRCALLKYLYVYSLALNRAPPLL